MVIAVTVLAGLLAVAGLAVLGAQKGLGAAANERFSSIALFAAESGVAAGMEYLRDTVDPKSAWTGIVEPGNVGAQSPVEIAGNHVRPGEPGALLSAELGGWYEVTVLNNVDDPDFATGADSDGIVILRSIGHGPDGAVVVLEVELSGDELTVTGRRPCPGYAQRGISEDGSGRNDCLESIDGGEVATYRPTGSE